MQEIKKIDGYTFTLIHSKIDGEESIEVWDCMGLYEMGLFFANNHLLVSMKNSKFDLPDISISKNIIPTLHLNASFIQCTDKEYLLNVNKAFKIANIIYENLLWFEEHLKKQI